MAPSSINDNERERVSQGRVEAGHSGLASRKINDACADNRINRKDESWEGKFSGGGRINKKSDKDFGFFLFLYMRGWIL
jgi:hypothetical protein